MPDHEVYPNPVAKNVNFEVHFPNLYRRKIRGFSGPRHEGFSAVQTHSQARLHYLHYNVGLTTICYF